MNIGKNSMETKKKEQNQMNNAAITNNANLDSFIFEPGKINLDNVNIKVLGKSGKGKMRHIG